MNQADIVKYRLINQQIAETKFTQPIEIVNWFGAMQSQEYAMAKWAIGLRLNGLTDPDIEKEFNSGNILRTHVLRPTWHFVLPADIGWMVQLTAPRINAASASMFRMMGLDNKILKRSNDVLIKALEGGKHLDRNVLREALQKKKIATDEFRLGYLLMRAELDRLICSGPRKGKQFTYALLGERVDPKIVRNFTGDEALLELTSRYFTSRGPATVRDYTWWSGLTVKDAKKGVDLLPNTFVRKSIKGEQYIYAGDIPDDASISKSRSSFLMPDYDEYGIAYKDRSAIFSKEKMNLPQRGGNPVFNRMIIIEGRIAGSWRRTINNSSMKIETVPFQPLTGPKKKLLHAAVKRFSAFVGKTVE
jgi:hypothetical protein